MILCARGINGVLHIVNANANLDMLVNQQMFITWLGKHLGVKIVKPVLGVVDSNKEEEKWI